MAYFKNAKVELTSINIRRHQPSVYDVYSSRIKLGNRWNVKRFDLAVFTAENVWYNLQQDAVEEGG